MPKIELQDLKKAPVKILKRASQDGETIAIHFLGMACAELVPKKPSLRKVPFSTRVEKAVYRCQAHELASICGFLGCVVEIVDGDTPLAWLKPVGRSQQTWRGLLPRFTVLPSEEVVDLQDAAARAEEAEAFKRKASDLRRRLKDVKASLSEKEAERVSALVDDYGRQLESAEEKALRYHEHFRKEMLRADHAEAKLRACEKANKGPSLIE